jgi:hypothetical protein
MLGMLDYYFWLETPYNKVEENLGRLGVESYLDHLVDPSPLLLTHTRKPENGNVHAQAHA